MKEYPSADELWEMSPREFNAWRANNDLPVLFDYFREVLPEFDEWLKCIGLPQDELFQVSNFGSIFRGDQEKKIVRQISNGSGDGLYCVDDSDYVSSPRWREYSDPFIRRFDVLSSFVPYFCWIKARTGTAKPVMWDRVNKSYTDNFFFGGYRNLPPDSRVHIWRGHDLLKLGEVALKAGTNISDRNLDFADLDGLRITGRVGGGAYKHINYSSLRFLMLENASESFYEFHCCNFEKTKIINSKVQSFHFFDCDLGEFEGRGSSFLYMSFKRCNIIPFFERCDLRSRIDYTPPQKNHPRAEETYRLLKNAYNLVGQKRYAAEYFYSEQIEHRKNIFNAERFYKYRDDFPNGYPGGWSEVIRRGRTKGLGALLLGKLRYYAKIFFTPKYLDKYLSYKVQWLYSWLECLLWGYGVKPSRIVLSSLFFIFFYAIVYRLIPGSLSLINSEEVLFFDCIYFSVVTFTTLGYGDVLPVGNLVRLVAVIEALNGAFMMGLVVAGFVNRKAD